GLLLDNDEPVIWRGPMITKTIQQFLLAVEWGDLDFLVVDLPPGTGDAQLSLCQTVPLDGGVIIGTPQEASLGVVRKGIAMFRKVNVPILGIVENMSYFTAPNGERVEIFGHGGGKEEAARQEVSFLGEVPIFTEIREGGDRGMPIVVSTPNHPAGKAFIQIAEETGLIPARAKAVLKHTQSRRFAICDRLRQREATGLRRFTAAFVSKHTIPRQRTLFVPRPKAG